MDPILIVILDGKFVRHIEIVQECSIYNSGISFHNGELYLRKAVGPVTFTRLHLASGGMIYSTKPVKRVLRPSKRCVVYYVESEYIRDPGATKWRLATENAGSR